MATEVDPNAVASLKGRFAPDEPLFVVNLLRYREHAHYPEGSPHVGMSGREAYVSRYLPAFAEVNAGMDIKPIWVGNVAGLLTDGEGDQWDDVAIVQYPSFTSFVEAATSQAYIDQAEPHRLAALKDFCLIATRKAQLPG